MASRSIGLMPAFLAFAFITISAFAQQPPDYFHFWNDGKWISEVTIYNQDTIPEQDYFLVKKLEGMTAFREEWKIFIGDGEYVDATVTRAYDKASKKWSLYYVDDVSAQHWDSKLLDDKVYFFKTFTFKGMTFYSRQSWSVLPNGKVLRTIDRSEDQKSWQPRYRQMFKRVEEKSVGQEKSGRVIDRSKYRDQLYGFWLGQCIANWTGLVTEMDKIGNIGDIQTGPFYTRDDWGKPDQPSIWGEGQPSDLSPTIDFVFRDEGEVWGADDDTDIEYMYQHLLFTNQTSFLAATQIRDGWMKHIKAEEENYLWVSNQAAFDLMKSGALPPATSEPGSNPHYDMIDAQLTTEIFGLYAPGHPEVALKMAYLPIRTTARKEAASISEFYVIMYSLATIADPSISMKMQMMSMAENARKHLPNESYPAAMYDFVKSKYDAGLPWEATRDAIYQRYQVEQADGYDITSRKLYCNGCFAAGINFAASLVSLFYGEGNFRETIKIGVLAGWDSDNPSATWGGMLGFMLGKYGLEETFERTFSDKFNIHRTRQNFPNSIDDFDNMAEQGLAIVDRVVREELGGSLDLKENLWLMPDSELTSQLE